MNQIFITKGQLLRLYFQTEILKFLINNSNFKNPMSTLLLRNIKELIEFKMLTLKILI